MLHLETYREQKKIVKSFLRKKKKNRVMVLPSVKQSSRLWPSQISLGYQVSVSLPESSLSFSLSFPCPNLTDETYEVAVHTPPELTVKLSLD